MFGAPKCPQCGTKATATPRAFPFAQWECRPCKKLNALQKVTERRIKELEESIKVLSKSKDLGEE